MKPIVKLERHAFKNGFACPVCKCRRRWCTTVENWLYQPIGGGWSERRPPCRGAA